MIKVIILLTCTLVSFNMLANDKIVGGEEVKSITEAPFIVKLKGGCAGSIISENWIMTAAHCQPVFTRGMSAGSLDANSNNVTLEMDDYFIHPDFVGSTLSHDFALIKLKQPIPLNGKNLKAVKLADYAHDSGGYQAPGVSATVLGWGAVREGGDTVRYLRKVQVPIVSNQTANHPSSYDGDVDDSMLAAGFPKGAKDACQGDSGGPMVTTGEQGEQVLVGVVSWGDGCARRAKYGIYSRISYAYDWIMDTVNNN